MKYALAIIGLVLIGAVQAAEPNCWEELAAKENCWAAGCGQGVCICPSGTCNCKVGADCPNACPIGPTASGVGRTTVRKPDCSCDGQQIGAYRFSDGAYRPYEHGKDRHLGCARTSRQSRSLRCC